MNQKPQTILVTGRTKIMVEDVLCDLNVRIRAGALHYCASLIPLGRPYSVLEMVDTWRWQSMNPLGLVSEESAAKRH